MNLFKGYYFHYKCNYFSINRQDKNGDCALIIICKQGWINLLYKISTLEVTMF